jgi:hypothetical protein
LRAIFFIEHWRSRRMRDLRERRDEAKIRSIRRRASKQTASNLRPRRLTATGKATAHQTVSVHELALGLPAMSALGQKQTLDSRPLMSALPPKADIDWRHFDVRFVPRADITNLFDQLVRASGQRQWHCDA